MTIQKRQTVQKSAIEEGLLRGRGHISAEELHLLVRKHVPKISIGTIYRNLKSLVEDGRALKVVGPDGLLLFESKTEKHHHLRCINCKKVFNCSIDTSNIQSLSRKVSDENSFTIKDTSITFEGFCALCKESLNK